MGVLTALTKTIVAARRAVTSAPRGELFYFVVGLCLVVVAAWLRFRGLSVNSLWGDEAVAANNSRGSLQEVLPNTRNHNSSPILYPLILYAVQLVESTAFSVRAVPAAAGTMTVAALVFLLPRVGIARPAAFLAGLMLTVSTEAIQHSQDAREYSVDALLAVLMIFGLLKYKQDGSRTLLCAALFAAPLLQYGLVLFGMGVLGTAVFFPPPPLEKEPCREHRIPVRTSLWSWLDKRRGLVWPSAWFLSGCVVSGWLTLRFQYQENGFDYLSKYYYRGKYTIGSVADFTASQTWELLGYHLPHYFRDIENERLLSAVVMLAVCWRLFYWLDSFLVERSPLPPNPVIVLFLFAVAIANFAAVLGWYPLGGIRQNIYLGPVIFLAVASVFHTVVYLPARSLRSWLAPALLAAVVAVVLFIGVHYDRNGEFWPPYNFAASALKVLDERVRPGDVIYVDNWITPVIKFYQGQDQGNFIYWGCLIDAPAEVCFVDALKQIEPETKRLWMFHSRSPALDYERLELVHPSISTERHFYALRTRLWLITNPNLLKESKDRLADVIPGLDVSLID